MNQSHNVVKDFAKVNKCDYITSSFSLHLPQVGLGLEQTLVHFWG